MRIGVPKEVYRGEKRVAVVPETVRRLKALGYEVLVEEGAGSGAEVADSAYRHAGAALTDDPQEIWNCDIVLKVRPPQPHPKLRRNEADLLKEGGTLIGFIWPAQNGALLEELAAKRATVLAMDCVPRISRAQKLDALSSMAACAGYRAVVEAAEHFGGFLGGQVTAAGKIPPAKVLVVGAGVAGLAAIATAVSLGAQVRAFDIRPEVREQVESLGAEFLTIELPEETGEQTGYAKAVGEEILRREHELFAEEVREVEIVITTALIPGKPAPKLILEEMVASMKRGSVIVDLAAEQGGNCELTEPGKLVHRHGVTIIGYTDLPSRMAPTSSRMYATNLYHLMEELTPNRDGRMVLNMEDPVIRSLTVVKEGKITWPPPPIPVSLRQPTPPPPKEREAVRPEEEEGADWWQPALVALGVMVIMAIGSVVPQEFLEHLMVFVLACFTGYMVIWNVTPALHTPLMSVTNAISSVIIIGALLQITTPGIRWVAALAVLLASVNIFGGFLVTQRMLQMFRKEGAS